MPAQAPLITTYPAVAQAPGALVLGAADLSLSDLLAIITRGSVATVTTLNALRSFLFGPFVLPARVVLTDAAAVFAAADVALLINKTVAGATAISLPTPVLSRVVMIKDMKGDAGANNITLDAGAGNLINGLQTLVMNANYGTTLLIGMSDTQWGTIL